jgi:signal peptidase II
LERSSLILILSGALGNGFDRLTKNYVVDFIDVFYSNYHWPAFNFADSYITLGGILYFSIIIFKK